MFDMVTILVEVSLAASAAAGAGALTRARRRANEVLLAPLGFDAGRPVSLVALYADWNGEVDVLAELAEHTEIPLSSGAALARAVALLQAQPAAARRFMLATAAQALGDAALAGPDSALAALDRLERAFDRGGWGALVAAVNAERGQQPFLPVASLLPGGLPQAVPGPPGGPAGSSRPRADERPEARPEDRPGSMAGGASPDEGAPAGRGSGPKAPVQNPLDWLSALGFAREGTLWVTVEGAWRNFSRKRSQDALRRSFEALGQAFQAEWRRKSPLALHVRRNLYAPLDAYRGLALRAQARARAGARSANVASALTAQLERRYLDALKQAERLVTDQCATLERIVSGRQGALSAGEALYRFRENLLWGIAPQALPLAPVEAAMRDWRAQAAEIAGDPERS